MSETAVSGRFETSVEKFFEMTKDRPDDVIEFDLREVLAELLVGSSSRLPRLAQRVWRRSCDEIMSENRGLYCLKEPTTVRIFFPELNNGTARTKTALIKNKIPQILAAAKNDESILDAPLPVAAKPTAHHQSNPELARLMKEGLPDNPTLELVKVWCGRALQNLSTSEQKMPLTRDMAEMAMKSDISFLPLWSAGPQSIIGSSLQLRSPLPSSQWNSGEAHRQDLALLFSTLLQLYSAQSKGQTALVLLPVRAASLLEKDTAELYMNLLRRTSPEVKKNILFEIRNMPKDTAPANLVTAVEAVAQMGRALIFETGLLTYATFQKQFPKLHACSYDALEAGVNPSEQPRLMKKYAEHYHAAGFKTCLKNAHVAALFTAAVQNNFAYISGPFIRPARKTCFTLEKLPQSEIGRAS